MLNLLNSFIGPKYGTMATMVTWSNKYQPFSFNGCLFYKLHHLFCEARETLPGIPLLHKKSKTIWPKYYHLTFSNFTLLSYYTVVRLLTKDQYPFYWNKKWLLKTIIPYKCRLKSFWWGGYDFHFQKVSTNCYSFSKSWNTKTQ